MRISGLDIITEPGVWRIRIHKPIYGTCLSINDVVLQKAIRSNVMLDISCPGGQELVDPLVWKSEGKRVEKVFKRPDNPMVMYQREIRSV